MTAVLSMARGFAVTVGFDSTLVNDLTMAGFLVGVIALMILPLPTLLIDSLLAINLSISVLLLMTTLFIPDAVSLSTFPSLLLFTSLFRLSLTSPRPRPSCCTPTRAT